MSKQKKVKRKLPYISGLYDGVELARKIYEKDRNIRLVLMSAFDRADIPLEEHEFVQKPIHIARLKEIVTASPFNLGSFLFAQ